MGSSVGSGVEEGKDSVVRDGRDKNRQSEAWGKWLPGLMKP